MKPFLLLCCLFSLPMFATQPQVALMPFDKDAAKLVDLVLVAPHPHFNFLERAELDKLLREQQLAATGLTIHKFSPNFKLLKNVDLFVLLGQKNLIVFDADIGSRLIDRELIGTLEQQSQQVATALEQAQVKREKLVTGKLLCLSFIPLVPINLTQVEEKISRQVEKLLIRQIVSRPDTVVLERHYLSLLLNEPNYRAKQLAKNILASAILIRLAIGKADGSMLRLTAFFSTIANTKTDTVTSLQMLLNPAQPLQPQLKSFLKFSSQPIAGSRKTEATEFAEQAKFAAAHQLFKHAIVAAEDATILNKEQELILGEVAAIAAYRAWYHWGIAPPDKIDDASHNFATAVHIFIKYKKHFNFPLMRFISKFAYVYPETFKKLSNSQQQALRNTFELYFAYLHHTNKYLLSDMKTAKTLEARLLILNNRGEYLTRLACYLKQNWDYRYWNKYFLPELEIYIKELNEVIPQIKASYTTNPSWLQQHKYETQSLNVVERLFGDFSHHLYRHKGKNRQILLRTFELLESSKSLVLAQHGAFGKLLLSGKKPPQASINKYVKTTIQQIKSCAFLHAPHAITSFNLNRGSRYLALDEMLKICKVAAKQLAVYNLFGNINYRHLTNVEAAKLYKTVKKYRRQYKHDPRVKIPADRFQDHVDMALEQMLKTLENKFPNLKQRQPAIPMTPFSQILHPCPQYYGGHLTQIGYRDNKIFFAVLNRHNETFLVSIDLQHDFAVKEYKHLKNSQLVWYGHLVKGVLIKDYYVAQSGPYVVLYPLSDAMPEIINFSTYYNDRPLGIAGYGNKLFISYGQWAGDQKPGTLLEYDVKTRQTKILVSTLDRSVKWPLQGRSKLFHVSTFTIDQQRQCLLTIFPKNRDADHNTYQYYLYGYFWKSGQWQKLSKTLRLSTYDTKIYAEPDGIYFSWLGLWKLQPNGTIKQLISPTGKGFTAINQTATEYPRYYIRNYKAGIAYCSNAILVLSKHKIYRFTKKFSSDLIIGQKYLISNWNRQAPTIGILKNSEKWHND